MRSPSSLVWRLGVPMATAVAGVMFVSSALSADGTDLRSAGAELSDLVEARADQVTASRDDADRVRDEIADLSDDIDDAAVEAQRDRADALLDRAGFSPVSGEGMRISLSDAPQESLVDGVEPNDLVVHQQDIQAFVNAMWAGGAEGVTLQGQRMISTTGIKCVGNVVVIESVPYAPPYVIEAVGDVDELQDALDASTPVQAYLDAVGAYELGFSQTTDDLDLPAHRNAPAVRYADPLD